jgi:hypothetical protein
MSAPVASELLVVRLIPHSQVGLTGSDPSHEVTESERDEFITRTSHRVEFALEGMRRLHT